MMPNKITVILNNREKCSVCSVVKVYRILFVIAFFVVFAFIGSNYIHA